MGVFHPHSDGTKLVTTFPTSETMAVVDLPPDIKVGDDTLYVRYQCLCNGHHWARCESWHEQDAVTWCIALAEVKTVGQAQAPKAESCEIKSPGPVKAAPPIIPPPVMPSLPNVPSLGSILGHPALQSLHAGGMMPILVLPMPTQVPVPVPVLAKIPSAALPVETETECTKEKRVTKSPFGGSPDTASTWWASWEKNVHAIRTDVVIPKFPTSKGPHYYVAADSIKKVDTLKEWIVAMSLDIPKATRMLVHGYILWHDRLVMVLNTSKVGSALLERILKDVSSALVQHDKFRVQSLGAFSKSEYQKIIGKP